MIKNQQYIIINKTPENVFTLVEKMTNKFPEYKILDIKSFFFHCQTGYIFNSHESKTKLNLDLIVDNPTRAEKVWQFFIKPIHSFMSRKVLKEIKYMSDNNIKV